MLLLFFFFLVLHFDNEVAPGANGVLSAEVLEPNYYVPTTFRYLGTYLLSPNLPNLSGYFM